MQDRSSGYHLQWREPRRPDPELSETTQCRLVILDRRQLLVVDSHCRGCGGATVQFVTPMVALQLLQISAGLLSRHDDVSLMCMHSNKRENYKGDLKCKQERNGFTELTSQLGQARKRMSAKSSATSSVHVPLSLPAKKRSTAHVGFKVRDNQ